MSNAGKAMSLFLLLYHDSLSFLCFFLFHFHRARADWDRVGCEKIEERWRGGEVERWRGRSEKRGREE